MNDHNRLVEQEGVYYVGYLAGKLGYLFRQIKEHDKGVDAEIELTQSLGTIPPVIGVQVKARSKFKQVAGNQISITVTEQNLEYWKTYGRPVILVAYSCKEEDVYWTQVDSAKSVNIKISLHSKLDESTQIEFQRLISQYYARFSCSLPAESVADILATLGPKVADVVTPISRILEKAQEFLNHGEYQSAASLYESLISIYDTSPHLLRNVIVSQLLSGDPNRAIDLCEKLLDVEPEDWQSYFLLGNCLSVQEKYSEAEEYLVRALKIAPSESSIWNNLGLLHYWQGRNDEAFGELSLAAAYDPEDEEVLFNLALCSIALENYKKAIEYYDACIAKKNDFYDAYNNKGLLLRMLWQIWDALDSYEQAIEIDPSNPAALYNSAYLLKDLGYDERAIQRYYSVLNLRPHSGIVHHDLALLFCRVGNLGKARFHFHYSYELLRLRLETGKDEGQVGIIDLGYEVAYFIRLWITPSSITVISVDSDHKIALFRHSGMRKLIDYCSRSYMPLSPENPRQAFSPVLPRKADFFDIID